jgi:hypothetical protein
MRGKWKKIPSLGTPVLFSLIGEDLDTMDEIDRLGFFFIGVSTVSRNHPLSSIGTGKGRGYPGCLFFFFFFFFLSFFCRSEQTPTMNIYTCRGCIYVVMRCSALWRVVLLYSLLGQLPDCSRHVLELVSHEVFFFFLYLFLSRLYFRASESR